MAKWLNGARMAEGANAAPPPRIFSQPDFLRHMYMLCMVGSGNGASKWAEMLIGHVWGDPVVGTIAGKLRVSLVLHNPYIQNWANLPCQRF